MFPTPLDPQIPGWQTLGPALLISQDPRGSRGAVISLPDPVFEDLSFSCTAVWEVPFDLELIYSAF